MNTNIRNILVCFLVVCSHTAWSQPALNPTVITEDTVYSFKPMDNGSGPMWCRGNTCIVRVGDKLFASGLETLLDAKPLNNCLPLLFTKTGDVWQQVFRGTGRTREPGPLTRFADGRLFYSINPTLTEPDTYNGPSQPAVLQFDSAVINNEPKKLLPKWDGEPKFSEHSYRTFVADAENSELFLLQNIGYAHAEWSFFDRNGNWSAKGKLEWPFEEAYDKPQPVRLCYPAVALKNKQLFFLGVSDIVEPYTAWQEFKYELTGRKWDYDFRRLFFTWSGDITSGEFHDWTEIASHDKTSGWITPWDMVVRDDGKVYVIWTERAIDERLRETFFPDAKQRHSLELAIIENGTVTKRTTIEERNEGEDTLIASGARLHESKDNRLFIIYYASGNLDGKSVAGNFVREIEWNGSIGEIKQVDMEIPLSNFFTATTRAGNEPSNTIDLFGQHAETMRHASVQLYQE